MQMKDRNAQQQRNELSYLAHDARRIIASNHNNPRLRETLIRALCSRFSVGLLPRPGGAAEGG